jgi:hypothetical protein
VYLFRECPDAFDLRLRFMTELPAILPTTRIRRAADILCAELDDEIVLMSVERGSYYSFDSVGSDVWRKLEAETTLAALSEALAADYDADTATIADDLVPLLRQLRAEGIVEIVG